jgi:hypothetical protein
MAAVARPVLCQQRDNGMTHKPNSISTPVAGQPSCPRPVRVKLMRTGAYLEKAYPPDGDGKNWWQRLNKALGTVSSDFVNASLLQIQAAARSPFGTISETAMNAALAMIEAAAPKDEIQGAVAVQMSCTHAAAMAIWQARQWLRNGAANCVIRVGCRSFNEDVCDASGGASTPA